MPWNLFWTLRLPQIKNLEGKRWIVGFQIMKRTKNFGLFTHFRSSLSYLMCLNIYSANQDLSIHTSLSKFIDPHECVILCFHFAKMQRIFSTSKNAFKDRKNSAESFIKLFKKVESNNIAPIRIKWIAKLKRIH